MTPDPIMATIVVVVLVASVGMLSAAVFVKLAQQAGGMA